MDVRGLERERRSSTPGKAEWRTTRKEFSELSLVFSSVSKAGLLSEHRTAGGCSGSGECQEAEERQQKSGKTAVESEWRAFREKGLRRLSESALRSR
jgi:hypothetical protein